MRVSASSLPRGFRCLASIVLPRQDHKTKHATDGTKRHDVQKLAIQAGDRSQMPPEVADMLVGLKLTAEVAFAYDVETDTARVVGVDIGRAYGDLGPFEIPGSCDVLAVGNGRVVIVDWKGWEGVGAPENNEQILLYAIAAARVYNVTSVDLVIAHLADGNDRVYTATVGEMDLDAFAARLRDLRKRAAKASADPGAHAVEGRHCRDCPSFVAGCPKKRELFELVASGEAARRVDALIPFDDDEAAAQALEFADRVQHLASRLKGALKARALQRPIQLGAGVAYGAVATDGKRRLDGQKVWQVIAERYDSAAADQATKRTATQKDIEAVIRDRAPRGAGKKTKDEIMAELAKIGGIKQTPSIVFKTMPTTARFQIGGELPAEDEEDAA